MSYALVYNYIDVNVEITGDYMLREIYDFMKNAMRRVYINEIIRFDSLANIKYWIKYRGYVIAESIYNKLCATKNRYLFYGDWIIFRFKDRCYNYFKPLWYTRHHLIVYWYEMEYYSDRNFPIECIKLVEFYPYLLKYRYKEYYDKALEEVYKLKYYVPDIIAIKMASNEAVKTIEKIMNSIISVNLAILGEYQLTATNIDNRVVYGNIYDIYGSYISDEIRFNKYYEFRDLRLSSIRIYNDYDVRGWFKDIFTRLVDIAYYSFTGEKIDDVLKHKLVNNAVEKAMELRKKMNDFINNELLPRATSL